MRTKLFLLFALFTLQSNAQCWSKISSGAYHSIAIGNDGSLWAWGYNNTGQLGDGTINNKNAPNKIGTDTDWISVSAGYYHSFGIKSNGTLWAWGSNTNRQLGDGTNTDRITPVQIGTGSNWAKISGGETFSVAIKTDGTLWTWGSDSEGQMGNGTNGAHLVPTQVGTDTDWLQAEAGRYHVIALKTNNKLYAWGYNGNGQISNGGFGTTQQTPYLVTTTGTANFIKVEAGVNSSLAIKDDNTLWICGLVAPTNTTIFQQFASPFTFSNVSAGANHVVGVKSDGTLWAWGNNALGQISLPGYNASNIPSQVSGTNFSTQIGTNLYSSAVLKNDGRLYGFGQNHVGQIGDSSLIDKTSITAVSCPALLSSESFESLDVVSLYPNPVKNILNISLENTSEIQKVVIYDVTGKQVKFQEGNTTSIYVEDLKSGFYLLEVAIDGKKEVKKFIKQ
jgi:alpha-tubulin suppressor-like RCC1 family protein